MTNERVRQVFDLHFTTVSRLLNKYSELNGQGVSYSNSVRGYLAGPDFKPLLTEGVVEEYLALITGDGADGIVHSTHLRLGELDRAVFAKLHRAAREGVGVKATHASMVHPEPTTKRFYPHALVEAGRRWHARVYLLPAGADNAQGEFRDLAISRLRSVVVQQEKRPPEADPSNDSAWQTKVDVRVVPHPKLSAAQKQVIRGEYFKGTAAQRIRVRAALLHYTLHDLRCATNPAKQFPPEYQLCVDEPEALMPWLMPDDDRQQSN
ncbi:WYL domain-containing protein [Lysobacter yangpyeongensis]|uniref:WYL domain-containing protein n=1 Tax=Lysobacter yangpyeongensis TaxID=346182 RepID=UPI0036DD3E28